MTRSKSYLSKGEGWLADHPERSASPAVICGTVAAFIERPSLGSLKRSRPREPEGQPAPQQESLEAPLSLNEQRHGAVLAALQSSGAHSVLDLGCGEGKLLRELLADQQFERILGMDVSIRSLEIAKKRLNLDRLPQRQAERLKLIHGSLIYRDKRLDGFDAAAVVEVMSTSTRHGSKPWNECCLNSLGPKRSSSRHPIRNTTLCGLPCRPASFGIPITVLNGPGSSSKSGLGGWLKSMATRWIPADRPGGCIGWLTDADGSIRARVIGGKDATYGRMVAIVFESQPACPLSCGRWNPSVC